MHPRASPRPPLLVQEMSGHRARVAEVARAVRAAQPLAHLSRPGVSHCVPLPSRMRARRAMHAIDVSSLTRILSIDPDAAECIAEPGVPFSKLVTETLRFGLVPAVVPELAGITVGGAVAGCSIESMSFRVGGFHDTCIEYETLDTNGQSLICSREAEPLLFAMMHGSYGTLGVLASARFSLVRAKPFVRLEFRRRNSIEAFLDELRERTEARDYELIDAIAHGPDHFVLCLGRFVDEGPARDDWSEPYYRRTTRFGSARLATERYFFRYDADCHWITRAVPPLEHAWVRRALGRWLLGSDHLLAWSRRIEPLRRALQPGRRPEVVADVFFPFERFREFFEWWRETSGFFPLWIIPYRMPEPYPWVSTQRRERLAASSFMVDCGIYGAPNIGYRDLSTRIEEQVYELGGLKALIGRNHYNRERFWEIYDRDNYLAAKRRLDPRGLFLDIFEKLC